ncbi:O-antigen ligase family protein [Limimaricola sp.]|uniref:O-antigen ligase family protein n=1 Tax=Limimaricola sp. TaxID=2211665 RepID=UPI004059D95F
MSAALPGARASQAAVAAPLPWLVRFYLLALVVPLFFQLGPLTMTGLRLLLLLVTVPLTLNLLRGRYGRILPTDILFLLHLLWSVVSLAVNSPAQLVENAGSTGIEFIGGYAIGRACIRDRTQFAALIRALAVVVVLLSPFALFESLTGRAVLLEWLARLPGVTGNGIVPMPLRLGLDRAQTVFAHPIHHGLFCATAFSLAVVGLRGQIPAPARMLLGLVIAVTAALSGSSAALAAVALQLGLILWDRGLRPVTGHWWLLVALLACAYVAVDLLSNRTPLRVFMSHATLAPQTAYYRLMIHEHGLQNVWANPVFGLGLNDWQRPGWMGRTVDSFWLLTAMRHGLPGVLLLAAGYIVGMWQVGRSRAARDVRLSWMFTFLGLSLVLFTVHIWTAIYSFTFFLFGAGLWMIPAAPPDRAKGRPAPGAAPAHRRPAPVFTRFPAAARLARGRAAPGRGR